MPSTVLKRGRHRSPVARLHRCARCGLTGRLGRVLRNRAWPSPFTGLHAVCRDGLDCSARRAAASPARLVPSAPRSVLPAEPMAATFATFRVAAER